MKQPQSVREAQALTARLYRAWDTVPHNTPYAARLVAAAERAYLRQIRREAQAGNQRAQRWLELRQATYKRALQAGE
jgi:hypothetical protein